MFWSYSISCDRDLISLEMALAGPRLTLLINLLVSICMVACIKWRNLPGKNVCYTCAGSERHEETDMQQLPWHHGPMNFEFDRTETHILVLNTGWSQGSKYRKKWDIIFDSLNLLQIGPER